MNDSDVSRAEVHRSPPLLALAAVHVALFLAGIAAPYTLSNGASLPTPYTSVAHVQAYYMRFPDAARIAAFLQFGAAIPLGLFGVVIVSRLLFHRLNVAGVHIALFGGIGSAIFLGVSGLATWTLSHPDVAANSGALRAVQLLAFATGGVGSVTTFGLLIAGVSVPSLAFRLMPRWLGWGGLGIAAVAELSTVSLLFPTLSPLLPLARFPGLIWLLTAGVAMPRTRLRQANG